MKKIISILTLFILLSFLCSFTSFAEKVQTSDDNICGVDFYNNKKQNLGFDITYNKKTKTLTVSGKGSLGPSSYYPYWYDYGNPKGWHIKGSSESRLVFSAEKLIVNEGVTSLGCFMFANFTRLKTIELPDSLERISKATFLNCISLQNIKGGKNIKTIDGGAFFYCKNLKNVSFPKLINFSDNLLTAYEYYEDSGTGMIEKCWQLNRNKFNVGAFTYCENLEIVNVPNVTKIGNKSFYGCKKLKTINGNNILSKIKVVGTSAFYGCQSLKKISLPKVSVFTSGKTLNDKASFEGTFQNCISLESINIPNVNKIGANTFLNCKNLKKINSNNNLSKVNIIGSGAFTKCINIEKISLPKVKKLLMAKWIEDDILWYPDVVKKYTLKESLSQYYYYDGLDRPKNIGEKTYGIFEGCKKLRSVNIPNVSIVGARSFYNCINLKSLSMPKVENLGSLAFYNAKNLKTVSIKSTKLKSIGKNVFTKINSKVTFYLPEKHFNRYKKLVEKSTPKNANYVKL